MKIIPLDIPEVLLIEPKVFEDDRGFFLESYNYIDFKKFTNFDESFVLDCHSKSFGGVLRGLHYQVSPKSQDKLIRVIKGEILDVAVDIRRHSPTYGKYVSQVLSENNKKIIYIPKGFAHGFLTLTESAELCYKMTNTYSPIHERCIIWNDPDLNINWPNTENIKLSSKDLLGIRFKDAQVFE
jgi:dTDP-4-dehydrorhamnose 3,5-epimerase